MRRNGSRLQLSRLDEAGFQIKQTVGDDSLNKSMIIILYAELWLVKLSEVAIAFQVN